MPREDRIKLIQAVESLRTSRVIALVLGDRAGLETRVAPDTLSLLGRHLRAIGKQENIDLFLYTVGGDIMTAYRAVSLIREYCDRFSVLVPFRCQSAGTLLALGADEIVMVPEGQLSPVDPSTNGPYNPQVPGIQAPPGAPVPTLPVSVEEVIGYLNMAREVAEIKGENGMVSVFEKLTADVRPVALGQVFRARAQIRMLSRKLLESHMGADDGKLVDGIIKDMTEKLHSHDYLISRVEAKKMGLKVSVPDQALDKAINDLFEAYDADLLLRDAFNPMVGLMQQPQITVSLERAHLESTERLDAFISQRAYAATPQGIQEQHLKEGWETSK